MKARASPNFASERCFLSHPVKPLSLQIRRLNPRNTEMHMLCYVTEKPRSLPTKPQCLLGIHPGESQIPSWCLWQPLLCKLVKSQPRTVSRSRRHQQSKERSKLSASGQTLMLRDLHTFSDQEDFLEPVSSPLLIHPWSSSKVFGIS